MGSISGGASRKRAHPVKRMLPKMKKSVHNVEICFIFPSPFPLMEDRNLIDKA
jgi:hypothetical protein